jgi:hypothetical protein
MLIRPEPARTASERTSELQVGTYRKIIISLPVISLSVSGEVRVTK